MSERHLDHRHHERSTSTTNGPAQRGPDTPLLIVGMGATAEAFAALQRFFSVISGDAGLAFVVVMHAGTRGQDALRALVTRATAMPVELACDGAAVLAGHVYVAPPASVTTVAMGKLMVRHNEREDERAAIDTFFRSLAVDQRERAAGIALAGCAAHGTDGLRMIRAAGGLAMMQPGLDEIEDALAEIEVVPVLEMPGRLLGHARRLSTRSVGMREGRGAVIPGLMSALGDHVAARLERYTGRVLGGLAGMVRGDRSPLARGERLAARADVRPVPMSAPGSRDRALLASLASAVWTSSAGGDVIAPQPGLGSYTGQPFQGASQAPPGWLGVHGPYRGRGWLLAVHPEDRGALARRWREAIDRRQPLVAALRLYQATMDGYRHVELHAVPVRDPGGAVAEWGVAVIDADERARSELAREDARSRLELAVRATGLGIFDFDMALRQTRTNQEARHIFGLRMDRDSTCEEIHERIHPGDRERIERAMQRAIDGLDDVQDQDFRVCWPDGSVHWVASHALVLFENRGEGRRPVRLIGSVQDVTDKMRVYRELEQRAAQQAAVSELGLQALQQPDLQTVLDRAAEIVANTLHVRFCKVVERLQGGELLLRAGVGWQPGLVGVARTGAATSQAGYTLHREQPVVVWNLAEDTRFEDVSFLTDHEIRSGMSVVIKRSDGQPWGAISAHSDSAQVFTQEDVNFLQAIANILASTIERTRTEVALREAKQSAEEANAAKDQFLAVLSHELRTPLTPVITAIAALEGAPDVPERVREVVRMIRRNVDLEARLINDLLDLTRINQGKLALEPQAVSARELIERTIDICTQDAAAKRIALEFDIHGSDDWLLHVDPSRAMQIFWNLLNNAIKYTPRGGRVEVRCADAPGHMLRIDIKDTGVGMDSQLLARVFNPFEQGPPATDAPQGQRRGLGLGLAIVRALVNGHGGTVTAQSAGLHRGTTFRIELPLAPQDFEDELDLDKSAPIDAIRLGPIRVLLVEDHEDSAEILAMVLQSRGIQIVVAASGQQALDVARRQLFDLVVSDIGLPDMSGYELFSHLRALQPTIVGIAYSGYGRDTDVQKCLDAGFGQHLTKPVDVGKLERAIYRLLRRLPG